MHYRVVLISQVSKFFIFGFLSKIAPTFVYIILNVPVGTGYSLLACSLWPMVSFIVPKEKLGTAYGFMQAIQNLGLALTAMLSGVIVDRGGYMQLLMFFLTFQGIAFVCVLILWKKHGINCEPIQESYEGSRRQSSI